MERNWRQVLRTALPAAAIVLAAILLMHLRTGDAFRGVRIYRDSPQAYVGQIFAWPLHSLIVTPSREHIPLATIAYIYIHVAIVLFACGKLIRAVMANPGGADIPVCPRAPFENLNLIALTWLLANTLFVLCIGSGWGFRHFPRFSIPSQPALFWAIRDFLPKHRWVWVLGGIGVFVLAVVSVKQSP